VYPMRSLFLIASGSVYLASLVAGTARAEFASGSDGSDGDLDCSWLAAHATCDRNPCACSQGQPCICTIDLRLAEDGHWRDSPGHGAGVYDVQQWAVVFKFSTIEIPANLTIRFENHSSGAPVAWLALGGVTVTGTVNLDGAAGNANNLLPSFSEPGPGGFQGATRGTPNGSHGSVGLGPGGSDFYGVNNEAACFGVYASYLDGRCGALGTTYGNPNVFPLIGGSGGSAAALSAYGSGAGGGAILIATNEGLVVTASGRITAAGGGRPTPNGSSSSGSGGAIRLVAGAALSMAGALTAYGGPPDGDNFAYPGDGYPCTQNGRILLESPSINVTGVTSPSRIQGFNCPAPALVQSNILGPIFPTDDAPILEIVSVDGAPTSSDPRAGILTPDVEIDTDEGSVIVVRGKNLPIGTSVTIRVAPERGHAILGQAVLGDPQPDGYSHGSATLAIPPGRSEVQLRANWTP